MCIYGWELSGVLLLKLNACMRGLFVCLYVLRMNNEVENGL